MKKIFNIKFKNNAFVIENENNFNSLNSKGFGSKIANNFFLMSHEVLFLLEKNKIKVEKNEKKLTFEDCLKISKLAIDEYLVYKDLKIKGYQIKSGAKYGFTFRIYDKGTKSSNDHSLWLVDIFKENKSLSFREILGKNRVAHSTNKKMIFAIFDEDKSITYLENSWKRM